MLQTLGKPSFASQFNTGDWYYVARDSRNLAYHEAQGEEPDHAEDQLHPRRRGDRITRTGVDQVASISPYGKTTPTLGRKRSFFEELFGNIGSVGAAGRRARAAARQPDSEQPLNPCSNLTGAFAAGSVRLG